MPGMFLGSLSGVSRLLHLSRPATTRHGMVANGSNLRAWLWGYCQYFLQYLTGLDDKPCAHNRFQCSPLTRPFHPQSRRVQVPKYKVSPQNHDIRFASILNLEEFKYPNTRYLPKTMTYDSQYSLRDWRLGYG